MKTLCGMPGERYTLRIGICACSNTYRGKFQNCKLGVASLAGKSLPLPLLFTLEEVAIPEDDHHPTLRTRRCHFFLDHDPPTPDWESHVVWLETMAMFHRRRSKDGWQYSNWFGRWDGKEWSGKRDWTRNRPPAPTEIFRQIQRILQSMKATELRTWLTRLRPVV